MTQNMPRRLYGIDCPVNAISERSWVEGRHCRPRFPNAISDWYGTPLTLRERRMMALMGEITEKPEWNRKVFDEEIVSKWRAETLALNDDAQPERVLTVKAFDYCMEELRDYAPQFEKTGMIPAIHADGVVYKSDTCVTAEMKAALKAAAAVLEDVDDSKKDWHPHSDEKVLDLVHPSLFPLLYGRSTVLSESEGTVPLRDCDAYIGKGLIAPIPKDKDLKVERFHGEQSSWPYWRYGNYHFYSKRYQWLPCEVAFRGDDEVEITSYINNLHPRQHEPLYKALESIIAKVIPMWDGCLNKANPYFERPPPRDDANADWIDSNKPRPRNRKEERHYSKDEIWDLDEEWRMANRILIMPDLQHDYQTRANYIKAERKTSTTPVNLRKDWAQKGLQIIVKLANIHLTPEKPEYEGGSWHIEGQLNEHICASALYYYDMSNITTSHLSFRESTAVEHLHSKPYEQYDHAHFERVYDIPPSGSAIQFLGNVLTRENRVLAFPNVFQHRVEPFRLADATRSGHRKILALFLVDPYIRVPSTANVPPQQMDWWRDLVECGLDRGAAKNLPREVVEGIVESGAAAGDGQGLPIELEEAKKIRLELMEERKMFVRDVDRRFEMETFSFCEH